MTTWELIRYLTRADPTGDRTVMLNVKYDAGDTIIHEACGIADEMYVELADDGSEFIVLEALNA